MTPAATSAHSPPAHPHASAHAPELVAARALAAPSDHERTNDGASTRAVPRILLLSGTAPGASHSGWVFLHELCQLLPPARLAWFTFDPRQGPPAVPPALQGMRLRTCPPPLITSPAGRRTLPRRLATCARFHAGRRTRTPRLRDEAVALGRAHAAELVWATLDHPALYRLAVAVAERLDLPLVTTIWDPPQTHLFAFHLDGLSIRTATRDFDAAVRRSERAGVMCEAMRDEFANHYGIPCVIMRHGLRAAQCHSPATQLNDSRSLTIGFAGGLYARAEWRALIDALNGCDWRIAGREVRLRLLTHAIRLEPHPRAQYEYLGYRSTDETIGLLAETDLTYLPYWFDPKYRAGVRLCFPSKLTAYAAAGRPVLYHGPFDSSPRRFFDAAPLAFGCHAPEPAAVLDTLTRVAGEPHAYAAAARAAGAAARGELSLTTFRARFARLLDVDVSALRAVDDS